MGPRGTKAAPRGRAIRRRGHNAFCPWQSFRHIDATGNCVARVSVLARLLHVVRCILAWPRHCIWRLDAQCQTGLSESVKRSVIVENDVRCPSFCFGAGEAGYIYDKMKGSAIFHILVFGSDLQRRVRQELLAFSKNLSDGFYAKFSG